jgi:hypothetical protein
MTIDIATIEHECNAVRRHVAAEFPSLTINFIVYNGADRSKSLRRKQDEIIEHPAGPLLISALRLEAQKTSGHTLPLMAQAPKIKFWRFAGKKFSIAACFIDADILQNVDDARIIAYASAWHVLNTLKTLDTGILKNPDYDQTILVWNNMLADAFGCFVMEMRGKKGFIRSFAKKLALASLSPAQELKPETQCFPIIMDAALLLYDDIKSAGFQKEKILTHAMTMTSEIAETFDQDVVLQWQSFCGPAQDMAWMGTPPDKILSAATYGSNDTYARSTAYLVAEAMEFEPAPLNDFNVFNVFADDDVNYRHHKKISDDVFENLMFKINPALPEEYFLNEIKKRNEKLLQGQIMGWCAPALMAAMHAYKYKNEKSHPESDSKARFDEILKTMNGDVLRKLFQIILNCRKSGIIITADTLMHKMEQEPALKCFATCL